MQEDKAFKEMMCRMVLRCNKVRKHKPKKVKSPVLKIDSLHSEEFPDSEIKGNYYKRENTKEIRGALRNLVSNN